jgi:hypothetical protein
MTRLFVLLGFQLAWFATAFSVMAKRPAAGLAMSAAICAAHFMCRRRKARLLVLLVLSGGLGYLADSTLVALGFLRFDPGNTTPGVPLWMVLLWANLALTLDALPRWVTTRLIVLSAAGAIGGAVSYLAGNRFDALDLTSPRAWSVAAVAIEWAIAMPLLVALERLTRAPVGAH